MIFRSAPNKQAFLLGFWKPERIIILLISWEYCDLIIFSHLCVVNSYRYVHTDLTLFYLWRFYSFFFFLFGIKLPWLVATEKCSLILWILNRTIWCDQARVRFSVTKKQIKVSLKHRLKTWRSTSCPLFGVVEEVWCCGLRLSGTPFRMHCPLLKYILNNKNQTETEISKTCWQINTEIMTV